MPWARGSQKEYLSYIRLIVIVVCCVYFVVLHFSVSEQGTLRALLWSSVPSLVCTIGGTTVPRDMYTFLSERHVLHIDTQPSFVVHT